MSEKPVRKKPPTSLNGGQFQLDKKLGEGCFGEVYRGTNKENNETIAVKCEDEKCTAPQLKQEADMLNILRKPTPPQGFVECFWFGKDGGYNCLAMELLGRSVEDMVQKCQGKFKQRTTCLVSAQVLHRIEYLHSKGYVHRDIKPENFMFGIHGQIHHVYMIDFGLSKLFYSMDAAGGPKHISMRQKLSLTGTARYASINAHKGFEQSRRDDLEAIGHMVMYCLRGAMPWSGLDARTKQEKYKRIMEKKEQTPLAELCAGYHENFATYLNYSRKLEFSAKPDYNYIQELMTEVRRHEGKDIPDHGYEWFDDGKHLPANLVPLLPRGNIKQPDDVDEVQPVKQKKKGGFCLCGGSKNVRD